MAQITKFEFFFFEKRKARKFRPQLAQVNITLLEADDKNNFVYICQIRYIGMVSVGEHEALRAAEPFACLAILIQA